MRVRREVVRGGGWGWGGGERERESVCERKERRGRKRGEKKEHRESQIERSFLFSRACVCVLCVCGVCAVCVCAVGVFLANKPIVSPTTTSTTCFRQRHG